MVIDRLDKPEGSRRGDFSERSRGKLSALASEYSFELVEELCRFARGEGFDRMDFLMTWNSTHIANAELRPRVEQA